METDKCWISSQTRPQENRELLGRVRVLEERVWQLEGETRQLESVAGLRDPYSGKRRASRDHLVQQLAQQADTITRLTRQLRLAQVGSFFLPWLYQCTTKFIISFEGINYLSVFTKVCHY